VLIDETMTLASGASATLGELGVGPTPVTLAELEQRGTPDALLDEGRTRRGRVLDDLLHAGHRGAAQGRHVDA
jgi:hypothetical protein